MSVRDLESRLARDVEDKVLERLGYRETDIWLPGEQEPLAPRVEVTEVVSDRDAKGSLSTQVLVELQGSHRPMTIYKVRIPRTVENSRIRGQGVWYLQTDFQEKVPCYPMSIKREDARWEVILGVQRR